METKETSHACCSGKTKKVFVTLIVLIFLAIAAFSLAAVGWKMHEGASRGNLTYGESAFGRSQMMNNGGGYIMPEIANQFVLPQDAIRSGEIVVMVNDLDAAKQAVSDIAAKDEGNVYETFIAYASNNLKNGFIVVQVPAENFEATFGDLKKVGSSVVQEKTSRVVPVNHYPVPMMTPGKTAISDSTQKAATSKTDAAAATTTLEATKPEIATYPTQIQNKGYIKVVLVDYDSAAVNGKTMMRQDAAENILGVGNPSTQNVRNNLLIIIGVKLIFLIAILGLLLAIFKKIFHRIGRLNANKKVVHVVRQMPKARTRVVRIAKRK